MPATVTICEQNGTAPGSQHDDISNTNMGSSDSFELTASSFPITAGQNSYEKWQRFRCAASGNSAQIKNLKIWVSSNAPLATGATLYTNATTVFTGSNAYQNPSKTDAYRTPVTTASTAATYLMVTSTPSSANVGIAGSIAAENYLDLTLIASLTAVSSDYFVTQIKTSSDATAGTTVTMNYQYDEIA